MAKYKSERCVHVIHVVGMTSDTLHKQVCVLLWSTVVVHI